MVPKARPAHGSDRDPVQGGRLECWSTEDGGGSLPFFGRDAMTAPALARRARLPAPPFPCASVVLAARISV
jgi:hypothetical protein